MVFNVGVIFPLVRWDTIMAYRYCPECDEWQSTAEYTVDEIGETICREHECPVIGYLEASIHQGYPISHRDFNELVADWYDEREAMLEAAERQLLVE